METQRRRMTANELAHALRQRGIRQYQFAQLVGMRETALSATLSGIRPLTPERKEAIEKGIADLRLAEPVPPTGNQSVFDILQSASE
jgi:DNA-binding transcriptional regulator YdaS (Cro superfamily)